MISEFRRAHTRRTHVGDVLRVERDAHGHVYEIVAERVWSADEYIQMKVDGRFYRYRNANERNSLAMPRRQKAESKPSLWRLT